MKNRVGFFLFFIAAGCFANYRAFSTDIKGELYECKDLENRVLILADPFVSNERQLLRLQQIDIDVVGSYFFENYTNGDYIVGPKSSEMRIDGSAKRYFWKFGRYDDLTAILDINESDSKIAKLRAVRRGSQVVFELQCSRD